MREAISVGVLDLFRFGKNRSVATRTPRRLRRGSGELRRSEAAASSGGLSWNALPLAAQLYVALVVVGGTIVFVASLPLVYPRPLLLLGALMAACVTAVWKVNLPIPLSSGSTLSVSCAAKLMALLLLGPR